MSYSTRQEVRDKIEWEGGITEALDYGLRVDDMPKDDAELRAAWDSLVTAHESLRPLARRVEELLEPDADEAGQ